MVAMYYYEGVLKVGAYESMKLRRRFVTVVMNMQDHDRLQMPVNEKAADSRGGSSVEVLRHPELFRCLDHAMDEKWIERVGLKLKRS